MHRQIGLVAASTVALLAVTTSGEQGVARRVPPVTPPLRLELDPAARAILTDVNRRTHSVYTYSKRGSRVLLDYRAWRGLLVLPDLAALPKQTYALRDERRRAVVDRAGRRVMTTWYRNADGTLSKLFVNRANQPVGTFTIDGAGNRSVAFDIDGDRRVDLFGVLDRAGFARYVASEGAGLRAYRELLEGRLKTCDMRSGARATSFDPLSMFGCDDGGSSEASRPGASASGARGTPDPLDRLCARLPSRPSSPVDRYADGASEEIIVTSVMALIAAVSPAAAVFVGITMIPSPAGEKHPTESPRRETVRMDEVVSSGDAVETESGPAPPRRIDLEEVVITVDTTKPKDEREPAAGKPRSGGSERDTPAAGESGLSMLAALCEARRTARNRLDATVDVREAQKCDSPYRMPVPGPADQPMGRLACTDPDDPFANPTDRIRSAGSNCGPFAMPGPDGTCGPNGNRMPGTRGGRGNTFIFFGSGLTGIEACDPRICDPAGDRRRH